MSAFMVEDKTINIVVSILSRITRTNYTYLGRQFSDLGYNLETEEGKEKLGQDMFVLNLMGVDSRYGEGEAKGFRPLNYKFKNEYNH